MSMRLLASFCAGTLLFTAAQVFAAPVYRLVSAPMPAIAGQELTLCAANVGNHKTVVTMKFVNVRTGAIVAQKVVSFAAPGVQSAQNQSIDPCLSIAAESIPAARPAGGSPGNANVLLVGIVTMSRKSFFDPQVTASIQIHASGSTAVEQIVPLTPPGSNGGRREVGYIQAVQ